MDIDKGFTFKAVMFAISIMFLLPTMIGIFVEQESDASALSDELLKGYQDFTGASSTNVHEELWVLGGIYTPYGIGINAYGSEYQTQNYFYIVF